MKIAHIITDMNGFGGTEATLLRYILGSSIPAEFHHVIVLKSVGIGNTLGAQMVSAGISVQELRQRSASISLHAMFQLYRALKNFQPDVISGWLYHPCLLASAFAFLLKPRPAVVWHIRSSNYASILKTPGRYVVQRMLSLLLRLTKPVLVSNSRVAVEQHAAIGFDVRPERWTIIHNGVNILQYFPQQDEGLAVRRELGIPTDALVIGCVGRFAPEKGYEVMFKALQIVLNELNPNVAEGVHFLAVGEGVTAKNEAFMKLAGNCASALFGRLHFLGKRADVNRILRALDIYVLPSVSEAFPNALVEAMATGLACVTTNVGECRDVLPATEFIVQPKNALQLAKGISNLIEMSRQERMALGRENRDCVVRRFELNKMVASFDALFEKTEVLRCAGT